MSIVIRVLSLGAGVQSTALALMAAEGELRAPDCAIFADTGWEPAHVYRHLDWLETVLPFPVYRVARGNLREECLRSVRRESPLRREGSIPAYIAPSGAPIRRHCTEDFKIVPVVAKIRELLGMTGRPIRAKEPLAEQWMGISTDEAMRMKPSRRPWIEHRWPLIETGMSRADCLLWMERHGYPLPGRSACIGCPYHSNAEWARLKTEDSVGWADAVAFDEAVRQGFRGCKGEIFLHRSLKPLREVDFGAGAGRRETTDQFGNECAGMCGV